MNHVKADYQYAWHCARKLEYLMKEGTLSARTAYYLSLELHETGFADTVLFQLNARHKPTIDEFKSRLRNDYAAGIKALKSHERA